MLLVMIFLLTTPGTVDSLKAVLKKTPQLSIVLELQNEYLRTREFEKAIEHLRMYEGRFSSDQRTMINLVVGDTYLFSGDIVSARDEYLRTVIRYPRSEHANNALEMLYLIEMTRDDTVALKRLGNALCLFQTRQYEDAADSIKALLTTPAGPYAYYYLARVYEEQENIPLAIGVLEEMNSTYPDHTVHTADLFLAELYWRSDNTEQARDLLEEVVVNAPSTIYAVRAREMLTVLNP